MNSMMTTEPNITPDSHHHAASDTAIRYFFRRSVLFTAGLLLLIGMSNALINPYLMFNGPTIKGINEWVTENYYRQLIFKPYQLRQQKPTSIILGSSQAGVALNPEQLPQPAYNLAIGGATAYHHHRLLQEAFANQPAPQQIILELPFFAFNSSDPNNHAAADRSFENRLRITVENRPNSTYFFHAANEILSSLVSWDTTRASIRMISKQKEIGSKQRGSFIQDRNGQWIQQLAPGIKNRTIMENSWRKTVFNDWLPAPEHRYTLPADDSGPLSYYRQNLRMLYANHTRSTLLIAPLHVSLLLALQEVGLWPEFQRWKHTLTRINAEEAERAGQPPFPLWDYANINPQTCEDIALDNDSRVRSQWFNDSAHASPAFGEMVLQEIQSGHSKTGRLLQAATVNATLTADNIALDVYRESHPVLIKTVHDALKQHTDIPVP